MHSREQKAVDNDTGCCLYLNPTFTDSLLFGVSGQNVLVKLLNTEEVAQI